MMASVNSNTVSTVKTKNEDVLEKRGLFLGETIGAGAYAKVKIAKSKHTGQKV